MYFSRPELVPIYIQITNLVTNTNFEGNDTIVQALMNYIGGSANGGLAIGENVIFISIPGVISAVPGVVDFKPRIGSAARAIWGK